MLAYITEIVSQQKITRKQQSLRVIFYILNAKWYVRHQLHYVQ